MNSDVAGFNLDNKKKMTKTAGQMDSKKKYDSNPGDPSTKKSKTVGFKNSSMMPTTMVT